MKKNIINLTPHEINLLLEGKTLSIPPSGMVARCTVDRKTIGEIDGIPITKSIFGEVENLPAPKENTVYIVSSLVAQATKDRTDVFIPDDSVRDEKGRIIGCRSLGRI